MMRVCSDFIFRTGGSSNQSISPISSGRNIVPGMRFIIRLPQLSFPPFIVAVSKLARDFRNRRSGLDNSVAGLHTRFECFRLRWEENNRWSTLVRKTEDCEWSAGPTDVSVRPDRTHVCDSSGMYCRFRVTEIGANGESVRKQKTVRLGPVQNGERRPLDHIVVEAQKKLAPVNRGTSAPEGSLTVAEFAKRWFLPTIEARRKPSTTKFYRDLVKNHIEPLLGDLRLNEVTTRDVQRMLDSRRHLSRQSCLRIKTGASAILSTAIQKGYLLNVPNAAREARVEGTRTDPEQHAHTARRGIRDNG